MGLNGLISNSQLAGEWTIERERSKQPIGACSITPYTLVSSLLSCSLSFCFSLCFSFAFCFSLCSYVSCCPSMLLFQCAWLRPFYIVCHGQIYRFTPQPLLAYYGCPSRTTHWFASCLATITTLYWLCHVPFPDKRNFVLFSCYPWHSHLDKGRTFSHTNSYSMYLVIPAHFCLFWVVCHLSRTFPLKELEQEPQNRLLHSPQRQTTLFLTSDPWPTALVLAGYRLVVLESCVCAPLPCESIACLAFTHLLLPVGLFGIAVCSAACLTFCGVGELLGLHSSYLVCFLGWVLCGCGPCFVG